MCEMYGDHGTDRQYEIIIRKQTLQFCLQMPGLRVCFEYTARVPTDRIQTNTKMIEYLKSPFTLWLYWIVTKLQWRVMDRTVRIDYMTKVIRSGIGCWVHLYHNTRLTDSYIGNYSYIAPETKVQNTVIGQYCSIGPRCMIGLGYHPSNLESTHPSFYSTKHHYSQGIDLGVIESQRITIGDHVWIGAGVIIFDGVRIGDHVTIAAGSVVNRSIKSGRTVGGNPIMTIK